MGTEHCLRRSVLFYYYLHADPLSMIVISKGGEPLFPYQCQFKCVYASPFLVPYLKCTCTRAKINLLMCFQGFDQTTVINSPAIMRRESWGRKGYQVSYMPTTAGIAGSELYPTCDLGAPYVGVDSTLNLSQTMTPLNYYLQTFTKITYLRPWGMTPLQETFTKITYLRPWLLLKRPSQR